MNFYKCVCEPHGYQTQAESACKAEIGSESLLKPPSGPACHGYVHGIGNRLAGDRLMEKTERETCLEFNNDRIFAVPACNNICRVNLSLHLVALSGEEGFDRLVKFRFLDAPHADIIGSDQVMAISRLCGESKKRIIVFGLPGRSLKRHSKLRSAIPDQSPHVSAPTFTRKPPFPFA